MDIILTLLSKKTITPSIVMFRFQPNKRISFRAGQYLNLLIPSGQNTVEKSFSIASNPNQEVIELIVRIIGGGLASTFLKNLRPGDAIKARGPSGLFTIRQLPVGLIFFSSGTGLAPIRSIILDTLIRSKKQVSIFLCIAQNHGEEFLLKGEFDCLADNHTNFQFEYSADPAKIALTKTLKNDDEFYICGGPIFVSEINETLIVRGIQEHRIHFEKY